MPTFWKIKVEIGKCMFWDIFSTHLKIIVKSSLNLALPPIVKSSQNHRKKFHQKIADVSKKKNQNFLKISKK